jgi:hypothetical protein
MGGERATAVRMVPRERIDDGLRPARQMRVALDEEAIEQYARDLSLLPPVKLMQDVAANVFWVVDGAHSICAAASIDEPAVRAIVTEGGYLDAFAAAAKCNLEHGVRTTVADKRHRVQVALADDEMKGWSDRRIAETCGVDHKTVAKLRPASGGDFPTSPRSEGSTTDGKLAEVCGVHHSTADDLRRAQVADSATCDHPKRVGKDGKAYPAPRKRDEQEQGREREREDEEQGREEDEAAVRAREERERREQAVERARRAHKQWEGLLYQVSEFFIGLHSVGGIKVLTRSWSEENKVNFAAVMSETGDRFHAAAAAIADALRPKEAPGDGQFGPVASPPGSPCGAPARGDRVPPFDIDTA